MSRIARVELVITFPPESSAEVRTPPQTVLTFMAPEKVRALLADPGLLGELLRTAVRERQGG